MALHGVPAPDEVFEESIAYPDLVPVAHFPVRRRNSSAKGRPAKHEQADPLPAANTWREINRFNRDVDRFAGEGKVAPKDSPYKVGYLAEKLGGDWNVSDPKARRLAAAYGCADALSQKAQKDRLRYFWQILILGVLAALSGQLYAGPLMSPWTLAVGIGFALIGTWRWMRLAQLNLENQYLDYRALAEACRVAFFWHICGIKACPADHYLRDQNEDMDWLRRALRALDQPDGSADGHQSQDKADRIGIRIADTDWIQNQRNYFGAKQVSHSKASASLGNWAGVLYQAALAAVVLTAVIHFFSLSMDTDFSASLLPSITVLYGMLFALSGLHKLYDSLKANQEHANSYRKMHIYFSQAAEKLLILLQRGDHMAAQRLLQTLGKQALKENADWLLLHRQRPVDKVTSISGTEMIAWIEWLFRRQSKEKDAKQIVSNF